MLVVLVLFLIFSAMFAITAVSGAPWVPVRKFDLQSLLDDAGVRSGTRYIELGCGDGRALRAAAQRGAEAIGYELNPLLWLVAWIRCWGETRATVRFANFWRADLSTADVVMAFLVPRTMPRLAKKAAAELSASARLVSYIFEIPGKKPVKRGASWYVYAFSPGR